MRVLLTGGYGCIGSWIVKNLLERGDEVWVYDLHEDLTRMRQVIDPEPVGEHTCRFMGENAPGVTGSAEAPPLPSPPPQGGRGFRDPQVGRGFRESQGGRGTPPLDRVRFVQGDVTDLAALRTALERNAIERIIHLAGLQVPVCRADPLLGAKVNVLGTLAVFEAIRALGGQIDRIVYASSAAVHSRPEDHPPGPIGDDVRLAPTTHYGVFKVANEASARVYWLDHGIASVGLRPWTVYGVGRDFGLTSQPTKAIKAAVLGRPFHVAYSGRQDLQYADDVAKTFLRAIDVPYKGAHAYNVRGAVVDMEEFCALLDEVCPEARRLVTYGGRQIPIGYDLDDSRLAADLGPIPKTPLAEGIRQTVERFRRLHAEGRLDTSDLDA